MRLRILIACECSGAVRDAFRALGHTAVSCDLKPSRAPGPHIQGDVREVLYHQWDMLIAHPVCRYLANSGAKHLYVGKKKENGADPERWANMGEAVAFFKMFDQAKHIPMRCVENPIMHGHAMRRIGRPATQYVQPWMFGDPFSKATGLWLTGLMPLRPSHDRSDYSEIKQDVWKMPPGPDREEKRSNTYPGIARAMAEQWGGQAAAQAVA